MQDAVSFGPFRLHRRQRQLRRNGALVKLGSRAFDVLLALVENAGEVVGHKELFARAWPGVFVEEVSLRYQVAALRKALESTEGGARYLTTVPGRGYCFAAPISEEPDDDAVNDGDESVQPNYALPPLLGRLIGRDECVRAICTKVTEHRFVSIVGPGGIGKTTVAVSVAYRLLNEFGGAVCFVDLSPISDPTLLAGTIASAFGIAVQTQDPVPDLLAHLRGKRVLLILDSSEHLVSEVADLSQRLFEALPALHILTTSRETLRAEAEYVHALAPLVSPPEDGKFTPAAVLAFPAVQLFVDRIGRGGFRGALSDQDARIVGAMCRQLGGIALAIELAAGRVAAYGIRDTAALLNSQFLLLWPGRRTAPARQQTLHATLDWSYNLLSDVERMVLRRLSVFAGGFTRHAALEIARGELALVQVDEAVGGLAAKFLLSVNSSGLVTRYRLLDTTRAYARRKLEETGERETIVRRHALYYCELVRATAGTKGAPDMPAPSATDLDDIRAALRWAFDDDGDALVGADIAAYSAPIWLDKGLLTESHAWMVKAAATCTEGDDASMLRQAHIQNALATAELFTTGFTSEAMADWTTRLERAEARGDFWTQFVSHQVIWASQIRAALYADAIRTCERCIAAAVGASDTDMLAMGEWMLGHSLHHAGRFEEAGNHLERYFALETDAARFSVITIGYDRFVDALCIFSNVLWMQGRADQAKECIDWALAEAQLHGSAIPITFAMLWYLLDAYLMEPDAEIVEHEAVELLEQSRTHKIDSDSGFAFCVMGLGQANRGEYDAGMRLVAEGIRVLSETQVEVFHALFRAHMCEAALLSGHLKDASSWMAELDRTDHDRDHWSSAEVLRIKGLLAAAQGNQEGAEAHLLNAIGLAKRQGALPWELRAAMSLARLWAAQHREEDALTILEAVYERFTEGHGTADLIKAKRLIDELKAAS